tara:strand:- start:9384 stop:9917 length:534 start_codon:yes stop_codon:yes gene_type:complete
MNLMKALIITWENFQDQEVVYPYYRIKEETDDVKIISNVTGRFHGIMGVNMTSHDTLDNLTNYSNYDFLVLPGGVKSLEKLRQEKDVLEFIRQWDVDGKLIASTCHGAQLMISAKITKGRKISGYYSIKDDINNSGAIYVDAPSVSDGNIVSSPHYDHMGAWMKEAITLYYANAERG